jgi:hypothetical protein
VLDDVSIYPQSERCNCRRDTNRAAVTTAFRAATATARDRTSAVTITQHGGDRDLNHVVGKWGVCLGMAEYELTRR